MLPPFTLTRCKDLLWHKDLPSTGVTSRAPQRKRGRWEKPWGRRGRGRGGSTSPPGINTPIPRYFSGLQSDLVRPNRREEAALGASSSSSAIVTFVCWSLLRCGRHVAWRDGVSATSSWGKCVPGSWSTPGWLRLGAQRRRRPCHSSHKGIWVSELSCA